MGTMSTKLASVNPYLRNAIVRNKTVATSVATSSAIEGIRTEFGRPPPTAGRRKKQVIQKKS
jgi:hypothetical protein